MADPILSGPERSFTGAFSLTTAALTDGRILVFRTPFGTEGGVLGQLLNADGSASGAEFRIAGPLESTYQSVSASVLNDGRLAVVWSRDTGIGSEIGARIFDADGQNRGAEIRIGQGIFTASPGIAALASGGFAVSYNDATDLRNVIVGANGQAAGDILLGAISGSPVVASLSNGTSVTVASVLAGNGGLDIKAHLRGATGAATAVTLQHADSVTGLSAAPLANGRFLVTWIEGDSAGNVLKGRVYDAAGAAAGAVMNLAGITGKTLHEPSVQGLANGDFAVSFSATGATGTGVFLATYSSTGQPVLAPAPLAQANTGTQGGANVTTLADGRYVVSWVDAGGPELRLAWQAIDPRAEAAFWEGDARSQQFVGTRFGDHLKGAGGADRLMGEAGDDTLQGGSGDDHLDGGEGGADRAVLGAARAAYAASLNADGSFTLRDTRAEGDGQDTLRGIEFVQFADATLTVAEILAAPPAPATPSAPAPANLTLKGTARADRLTGGDGQDTLFGKGGNDVLAGRAGRDVFVFDTGPNSRTNRDMIRDYAAKDDSVFLENKVFTKLGAGSMAKPGKLTKGFFALDKARDKNDHVIYVKKTGKLFYDADGTGSKAAVEVAVLATKPAMSAAEFFVI